MGRLHWTQDGRVERARADGIEVFTITPHLGPQAWLLTRTTDTPERRAWAHNDPDYLAGLAEDVWRQELTRRAGDPDPRATLLAIADFIADVNADEHTDRDRILQDVEHIMLNGLKAAGITQAPCELCGDRDAPLVADPYLIEVCGMPPEQARRYLCPPCRSSRADEV
ncbi:hypothetical protein AB0395_22080 [Streptosporangium sp. NPDC051023]|uniref:hypothetical protein n=1 Tax=Streptosporangium sp. NPDC051023 TaxID=3155410 RepID=UPI00344CE592